MAPSKSHPIRVLVVDDSFFMRKMVQEMLSASEGIIEVLDTAQTGLEALEKVRKLKPDVITLDVEMPQMNGLEALERIMKERPTSVVMLSSHTGKGTETTIRALELGAVDCVGKPAGRVLENIKAIQGELIEKIKLAAMVQPRSRRSLYVDPPLAPALDKDAAAEAALQTAEERPAAFIVAVASSTGGPRALNELFSRFRRDPSAAYVVVQHISMGFTKALARRMAEVSVLGVTEAKEFEILMGGKAYVAQGGSHLVVEGAPGRFRFAFSDQPPRLGVKPSADIMMASVAKVAGHRCLGVVLTGMGRDGTAGLKEIRVAGGKTFAQDEESCVVYGMPKAAVDAGLVDHQLPLSQMAEKINLHLAAQKGIDSKN